MIREVKRNSYSEGIYTLETTKKFNQYLFFRNDNERLVNIGKEPVILYYNYMLEVRGIDAGINSYAYEMSLDEKNIRLTICPFKEVYELPKEESNPRTLMKIKTD